MSNPGRNDPCPCGSGKKYKHCHLGKPDDVWGHQAVPIADAPSSEPHAPLVVALPPKFDLHEFADEVDAIAGEFSPLDEAWEIVEEAWSDPSPKRRKKLAKEAIKISPDCAGAYFLLGQLEHSDRKRIELFDRAVATARRMLRSATLEDLAPGDWEQPEVEFAMYALQFRALTYVAAGQNDQAIEAFDELLELDPFDRLRNRVQLIILLIDLGRDDEAKELVLEDMDEQTDPVSFFAQALLIYRREGDTVFARRSLADAMITFPDLVDLLAGPAPTQSDDAGDELPSASEVEEQIEGLLTHFETDVWDGQDEYNPIAPAPHTYAVLAHAALWHRTEGARDWINAVRAIGPQVRYQTDLLGDGPALMLTSSKVEHYRRCPECRRKTDVHPLNLVLMLESSRLLELHVNARRCATCDIVSVDLTDLYPKAVNQDISAGEQDFVPFGYIPEEDRRSRSPGPGDQEWLRDHSRPWRRIDDEDSKRMEWPTLESQLHEIEEILQQSGLKDILGPAADLFSEHPGRSAF